jgi:hypothetical protein
MNGFIETDNSEYDVYNTMALSDNQGPEQKMALMDDSENSPHSTTKGDSALTAFLRSKQQNIQSGTLHTNSALDTFAREQEWRDDDDVPDDESIVYIHVNDIENDVFALSSSYKVPDDESIVSIDGNEDLIPVTSYDEDAADETLKWTEAFMDQDGNSDEESMLEDAQLNNSMSSFNHGFEKLASGMAHSALTRQLAVRQYSEKSLGSSKSTAAGIFQHSFNQNDSLQLPNPLGPNSSSRSSSSGGHVRPRIKRVQGLRNGVIRRHSHRSLSGQDIMKRADSLAKNKASLANLNSSLNSISLHGNSTWGNLSRSSTFRKPKLSQETSRSLMEGLHIKARLSQKVNKKQRMAAGPTPCLHSRSPETSRAETKQPS